MTAPSRYEVLKKATRLLFKIQKVRFETARAMLNALAQKAQSQKTRVVELAGYPAVFLDRQTQDVVVEPTPLGRLLGVSWASVFAELEPVFDYDEGAFQSIVEAIRAIVSVPLAEATDLGFYHDVVYGDVPGVYYLENGKVVVEIYDPNLGSAVKIPLLTLDGQPGCNVRKAIEAHLDYLMSPITVTCPDGESRELQYDPITCPHMDHAITYLRQLLERQWYCLYTVPYRDVVFVSGPLANAVINRSTYWLGIFGDTVANLTEDWLSEFVVRARGTCRDLLARKFCPAT